MKKNSLRLHGLRFLLPLLCLGGALLCPGADRPVRASSYLTVDNYSDDFPGASIERGKYLPLYKFKLTAGTQDIRVIALRLYAEDQDGKKLTDADISGTRLTDEAGRQLSVGSLWNGYWSLIYMSYDIPAGQTRTLTFSGTVSEMTALGKFRIMANEQYVLVADPATNAKWDDWNETDAARTASLTGTDRPGRWIAVDASTKPRIPNLATMGGYSSPANPYLTDRICYTVSVKNFGLADITGREITADVYVNGAPVVRQSYGTELKIGGEAAREVFCSDRMGGASLRVGNNEVKVVFDPDDKLEDSDETNDARLYNLAILDNAAKLPDLTPVELDCHPAETNGTPFIVCGFKVQNDGAVQVGGHFKVTANENSEEWAATPPVGKWVNSTLITKVPADGKITLTIDAGNLLHEGDETNNTMTYSLATGKSEKPVSLAEGALVRETGGAKVYILRGAYAYWIRSAEDFRADGFAWDKVIEVDAGFLGRYTPAVYVPGGKVVVRAAGDPRVYRIIGGRRLWIPSAQAFGRQGLDWGGITELAPASLENYPLLKLIKLAGSNLIYYVTNSGMKKLIPSIVVFESYGNRQADVVEVGPEVLDSLESVSLLKDASGKVYAIEGSKKKWIVSAEAFNRRGYDWNKIAPASELEINAFADDGTLE